MGLWLVVSATSLMAEGIEPAIGIVNRTNCGKFWRLDFNYATVDADGETPIVLSAAIFMANDIYTKSLRDKGCGLVNHYTIYINNGKKVIK